MISGLSVLVLNKCSGRLRWPTTGFKNSIKFFPLLMVVWIRIGKKIKNTTVKQHHGLKDQNHSELFILTEPDYWIMDYLFDRIQTASVKHWTLLMASDLEQFSYFGTESSNASGFRAPSLKSNLISERVTAGRGNWLQGKRRVNGTGRVYPMSVIITVALGGFRGGRDPQITAESGADSDVKHTLANTFSRRGVLRHKERRSRK